MKPQTLPELTEKIRAFCEERDWEQFHNFKDLALSLTLEAAEVLEHFQWKNGAEIAEHVATHRDEVADELADVAIYLLQMAMYMELDLSDAITTKLAKSALKYPVEKSKGNKKKYTEL